MLKKGLDDSSSMGGLAGPLWTHPRSWLTRSTVFQAEALSPACPTPSVKQEGRDPHF